MAQGTVLVERVRCRRALLLATLVVTACSSDAPARAPDESTTPSSVPGSEATPPPESTVVTEVAPQARGACESLRADDLATWFAWPVRGDLDVTAPDRCSVRLDGGFELTISSGTAETLAAKLDELASTSTPLEGFDPQRPETSTVHYDAPVTTEVAGDGTSVVVIENRGSGGVIPSYPRPGAAAFLVERMRPDLGGDPRTAGIERLEPVEGDGCWDFVADAVVSGGGDSELRIFPAGPAFTSDGTLRGRLEVGRGLFGRVTSGRGPTPSCIGSVTSSVPAGDWPLVAGRGTYEFQPVGDAGCRDGTLELSGLVAERPDDERVSLPAVTIANHDFGADNEGRCVFPAPAAA